MRVRLFYLIVFLFVVIANRSLGQAKEQRVLIVLDGSKDMENAWSEGQTNFKAGSQFITRLLDSVYRDNKDVEFALRVYGHQRPALSDDCQDSKREIMFSKDNRTQMALRLEHIRPSGAAAVNYALKEAVARDIENRDQYDYTLVMVTAGAKSCNGSGCEMAEELGSAFKRAYVVSVGKDGLNRKDYECLGKYIGVHSYAAMTETISTICKELRQPVKNEEKQIVAKQVEKKVEQPVIKETSLLFISLFQVSDIQLYYQSGDAFLATGKSFQLPMQHREKLSSGKYKVVYHIGAKDGKERVKEFILKEGKETTVDLD